MNDSNGSGAYRLFAYLSIRSLSGGIEVLPATLIEALDALEQNPLIQEALGFDYAGYYLQVKREEWKEYHNWVSEWERSTYLAQY